MESCITWTIPPSIPPHTESSHSFAILRPATANLTMISDATNINSLLFKSSLHFALFSKPTSRPATNSAHMRRQVYFRYFKPRNDSQLCANIIRTATFEIFKWNIRPIPSYSIRSLPRCVSSSTISVTHLAGPALSKCKAPRMCCNLKKRYSVKILNYEWNFHLIFQYQLSNRYVSQTQKNIR